MILTKKEIQKEIAKGHIRISPYRAANVGPASVDLTLGDTFWVFEKQARVPVSEGTDFRRLTAKKKLRTVTLAPGDFVLGITKEKITLSPTICAFLSGRSRFARLGILVHATASFVQPGISNRQVLEIRNISQNTLVLKPGLKLAQIIFVRTDGKAAYSGRFRNQ